MGLPWIQVASSVVDNTAPDLAVMLGWTRGQAIGGLVMLFNWALGRAKPNKPPSLSSVVRGPSAALLVARAAEWTGDPEAFMSACEHLPDPPLERLGDGSVRIRGLRRYDAAWGKNQPPEIWKAWKAHLDGGAPEPESELTRNGTVPEPVRKIEIDKKITTLSAEADELPEVDGVTLGRAKSLQELWNEFANPGLPRWRGMPDTRKRTAMARIREQPAWAYWAQVVDKINNSNFCRGENDRGWRASPDWLLRPETATNVLEGKYDNRAGLRAVSGTESGTVNLD